MRSVPQPEHAADGLPELDQDYYSATSHTFIGQLLRAARAARTSPTRPPGANQYPQLSAEYIIASDPDLIVLADTVCCGQTRATVAARPGWDAIAAVKDGGVVRVNDSIASQWGPRIVIFLHDGRARGECGSRHKLG